MLRAVVWVYEYIQICTYRWAGYKAAKTALDNVLQVPYVANLNQRNMSMIRECIEELKSFLMEGVLTEQFVTDNINPLIDCMRKCNVALRWRMLHRRTTNKKFHEMIVVSISLSLWACRVRMACMTDLSPCSCSPPRSMALQQIASSLSSYR